nr:peroxidase 31-like [Ipomoea batatas]
MSPLLAFEKSSRFLEGLRVFERKGFYFCNSHESKREDITANKHIVSPPSPPPPSGRRLFFHDCFVGVCDVDINLSLPGDSDGFYLVVCAKTTLELACPSVVSCDARLRFRKHWLFRTRPFVEQYAKNQTSTIVAQIFDLLRQPDSSAGDNLSRWLYDTFHSSELDLHLAVLRFLPIIADV